MSQTKKYKLGIFLIIALVAFFAFGCKDSTPVQDISFNLNQGEQIVMIVGQVLEIDDFVEIKPAYATNKKYTVESFNEDVIQINNNKLMAMKSGNALIRVVSKDNKLKECSMSVVVKGYKEKLATPLNFEYNSENQTFNFDPVVYASSYTIKINGTELNIGNTNSFSLADYSGQKYDTTLVAQIKANAPTYSYALESSDYCSEFKVYQAGSISNLKVEGGVASFTKSKNSNLHNVYIGNELILENTALNTISLKALDEKFAGLETSLQVETVITQEMKNQMGNDVVFYNSSKQVVPLNILGVPQIVLNNSTISWQNVAHSSGYSVVVDSDEVAQPKSNSYNLKNWAEYYLKITTLKVSEIKVVPIVASESSNVASTKEYSSIKVTRLNKANVVCDGTKLTWQGDDNVSLYEFSLTGNDVDLKSSLNKTEFSMASYNAGQYSVNVEAIPTDVANADGVRYLSSEVANKNFSKNEKINAYIQNYELKIINTSAHDYFIDYENDAYDDLTKDNIIKLYDKTFEAGPRQIKLIRMGDSNTIQSDEFVVNFVQLEAIDKITISNRVASVNRSENNENAVIKFVVTKEGTSKEVSVENNVYEFNTTQPGDECLDAGRYSIKVYVIGDGVTTFSCQTNKVAVHTAEKSFEVLSIPTAQILDTAVSQLSISADANAVSHKVYLVDGGNNYITNVSNGLYPFDLGKGTVTYAVQAVGDGSNYLDSAISEGVSITRLLEPSLKYNNITNVISKHDTNDDKLVRAYTFKRNGAVVSYDFASAFAVADGDVFTLNAVAINGSGNQYYLDSHPFELHLSKISNNAMISINALNQLVVEPVGHVEEYNLEVVFEFSVGNIVLTGGSGVISDGTRSLNYIYNDSKYYINLIDDNYNAAFEELKQEFAVKVKFIKASTGEDLLINSEYTAKSSQINLIKITNQTVITIDDANKLKITPIDHVQEYALNLVINTGEEMRFSSNGAGKLIWESVELDYVYDAGSYYVTILSNEYLPLFEIPLGSTSFSVNVQFAHIHNGINSDVDSVVGENKIIAVQPTTSVVRDGQNLKIANVKDTYTYINYFLLINGQYPLQLSSMAISEGGFIIVNVEYIYINTPEQYLQDVNTVQVVVKNVETSESEPILSARSGEILITKAQLFDISTYKYNNNEDGKENNSVVVTFNTYATSYYKQYIIEVYNAGFTNKLDPIVYEDFKDGEGKQVDGVVEFNLDDIVGIEGDIYISGYVATSGVIDAENIQVFNSSKSYELSKDIRLTRIAAPSAFVVSDSRLSFDSIYNSVGYEIYEKVGTDYTKINTHLITSNYYNLADFVGLKEIVIKAISVVGNYTNSSYSEVITLNKVSKPLVSVVDGKFNINFMSDILALLANPNISIMPEVNNPARGSVEIDLKNINLDGLKLNGTTLVSEPYLFMAYSGNTIIPETISVKMKVNNSAPIDGVYYLNSDVVQIDCHGAYSPTNVKKISESNDNVEMIGWTPSSKNIILDQPLNMGYVFKISYTSGGVTYTYYSNDSDLKYYDATEGVYKSYPQYITDTSVVFPAGYGVHASGELKRVFEHGQYSVQVQAIPRNSIDGYNLCSSNYSASCDFEIMPPVGISVYEGSVIWNNIAKADEYMVSVYSSSGSLIVSENTTITQYDFSNKALDDISGVCKVVVKALSSRADTLNSVESEPVYVYRLPKSASVSVDDGYVILSAPKYFKTAEIEFVDSSKNLNCALICNNEENLSEYLDDLGRQSWNGFTNNAMINQQYKYAIRLEDQVLQIVEGKDFTINIKLMGNTHDGLGIISSAKIENVDNSKITKLKTTDLSVDSGVIQFKPHSSYATVTGTTFTPNINLNYAFNSVNASSLSEFWNNTIIYKISIQTTTGIANFYVVDYYSFVTAVENSTINSDEYEIILGNYDTYAFVKFLYEEDATSRTTYFNVYRDNIINLKTFDSIDYYPTHEAVEDGALKLRSEATRLQLNLNEGGSFAVSVCILGGDSYSSGEPTNAKIGYLSSEIKNVDPFVRYGANSLSAVSGKVQFNNMIKVNNDTQVIDYPIYKLSVSPSNMAYTQIYYIYHTTEAEAKQIAQAHDAANYLSATYLYIGNDENTVYENENKIIFDLTEYISAGMYVVKIQTLAGLGVDGVFDADYLLDAKTPTREYDFHKLSDVQFVINNGVLSFEQSYIHKYTGKVYFEEYEVTIYDGRLEYVFNINRESDGVKINDVAHTMEFDLPAKISTKSGELNLVGNRQYQIKLKAIATDETVLNGTYMELDNEDVVLEFKKSMGVSNLRVEEGVIKWQVLDLENHVKTVVVIAFKDELSVDKYFTIYVDDTNKVIKNEVYQYHQLVIGDGTYALNDGYDYIWANYSSGDTINYDVYAYTFGDASKNLVHSNHSPITHTTRLDSVDSATIETIDGVLNWAEVDNAVKYKVKLIGDETYEFEAERNNINLLEEDISVAAGKYNIQIKAIGSNKISAISSGLANDFIQLSTVDSSTLKLENGVVVWGEVENASGYQIVFNYNNNLGLPQTKTFINTSNEFSINDNAVDGVSGRFTLSVSPVSIGTGKVFNGEEVVFTSTKDYPDAVNSFTYDEETSRLLIDVKNDKFFNGDKLIIEFNLEEYVWNNDSKSVSYVSRGTQFVEIAYQQLYSYEIVDENTTRYFHQLSTVGAYTSVRVYVQRDQLYSSTTEVNNITLHWYTAGNGTESNPYMISSAEELLNINYFPSSYFKLAKSIDMSSVDIQSRLSEYDAIIYSEFKGVLDGDSEQKYTIYKFNYDEESQTDTILLNDVHNFALFKTLDGATIKNLTIGQENVQLILSNMFANHSSNVVKLSMIATGAKNSRVENINVLNLNINVLSDTTNAITETLSGEIYIAGLISNAENTQIINSSATVNIKLSVSMSGTSQYVAGLVGRAKNVNITTCQSLEIKIESTVSNIINYVGGVIAFYEGNILKTNGVSDVNAVVNINNVQAVNIGGIIGLAKYVKINNVNVSGRYTRKDINWDLNLGGIIGWAQSSDISNSTSTLEFYNEDERFVTLSGTKNKYIGAIAGVLEVDAQGTSCSITNCNQSTDYLNSTVFDEYLFTLGLYGIKHDKVTVS